MGFVMPFLANYFLLPMLISVQANAIGNGIAGLMSVFFGAFMALEAHIKAKLE